VLRVSSVTVIREQAKHVQSVGNHVVGAHAGVRAGGVSHTPNSAAQPLPQRGWR